MRHGVLAVATWILGLGSSPGGATVCHHVAGGWPVVQGPGYYRNPMAIPGTTVAESETPDGAALTFTGPAESVTAIRERVKGMEQRHNSLPSDGRHRRMPPSRAVYDDVPNGARLRFVPLVTADVDALREAVKEHAEWLRSRPWADDRPSPT